MSVTCGFYNSIDGDRRYNAEQLTSLVDGIIRDGVFMGIGDALIVSASTGMNVIVGTGRAWFNSTWTHNDSLLLLTVDPAEMILNRIDAVVLEVNRSMDVRENTIKMVKGTPASIPVPPTLIKSELVNQYALAHVYVGAGVTQITAADITNKVGTDDCPFVTGILQTLNLTALLAQWDGEFHGILNLRDSQFANMISQRESEFLAWFELIEAALDENIATNLLNMINNHKSDNTVHVPHLGQTTMPSANIYEIGSTITIPENGKFSVKFNAAATGPSTLKISSDGVARPLKRPGGKDFKPKIGVYTFIRDGSNFQCIGEDDNYDEHLAECAVLIPKSGSTANAILLDIELTDKKKGSFRAAANNTSNMTINGKAFKKDADTEIPADGVKAGKVYDFYYDQTSDCVFILAKASGNAQPSDVLAGKTFSNDDGEQIGSMPDRGAKTYVPTRSTQTGASGYYSSVTVNPIPSTYYGVGDTLTLDQLGIGTPPISIYNSSTIGSYLNWYTILNDGVTLCTMRLNSNDPDFYRINAITGEFIGERRMGGSSTEFMNIAGLVGNYFYGIGIETDDGTDLYRITSSGSTLYLAGVSNSYQGCGIGTDGTNLFITTKERKLYKYNISGTKISEVSLTSYGDVALYVNPLYASNKLFVAMENSVEVYDTNLTHKYSIPVKVYGNYNSMCYSGGYLFIISGLTGYNLLKIDPNTGIEIGRRTEYYTSIKVLADGTLACHTYSSDVSQRKFFIFNTNLEPIMTIKNPQSLKFLCIDSTKHTAVALYDESNSSRPHQVLLKCKINS